MAAALLVVLEASRGALGGACRPAALLEVFKEGRGIPGGSGGIGAATGRRLAQAGLKVILVARGRKGLDAVASDIRLAGGEAAVLAADLTRESDCQRVFDRSAEIYGPVDLVVNCAGVGWFGYGEEMPSPTANGMMNINMGAVARLTLLFLSDMKARGRGHIINMGSIALRMALCRASHPGGGIRERIPEGIVGSRPARVRRGAAPPSRSSTPSLPRCTVS